MKDIFFIKLLKKIKPYGFSGLSIYDVTIFFITGLKEGAITTRASSLAFNFFLAFFPSIIVFFTLIPYIPIEGFQETLMEILLTTIFFEYVLQIFLAFKIILILLGFHYS